jgi:hypothetical protein
MRDDPRRLIGDNNRGTLQGQQPEGEGERQEAVSGQRHRDEASGTIPKTARSVESAEGEG